MLNGEKRYITNGAIADVLTVMARTPVPGSDETAITAFLVTPDMPGFEVVEAADGEAGHPRHGHRQAGVSRHARAAREHPRPARQGAEGGADGARLRPHDVRRRAAPARRRPACGWRRSTPALARQFGRPLGEFELVQKKLARMAAWTYAMEAMTTVTAGLIDRGLEDYMLETAMLKVWSTERLWTIVNDAFQIHGGAAYFTDRPLERMLRDHRINQIGEGANEVLPSFIAPGRHARPGTAHEGSCRSLQATVECARRRSAAFWRMPSAHDSARRPCPFESPELKPAARRLGKLIRRLGTTVQYTLIRHREEVVDRQLVQERIAWLAMELFAVGLRTQPMGR